ncbi:hypothetical protein GCM10022243_34430 [Saccharothrix violaceirubra]|uniref:Uncharacterized protein n=1 Tax=Saccharothrix violaceirubra TaxID=413306 RepID=A0A7W7T4L7_9PSEU|nr:hypothetical protein [Saccharothrix violaceirubra]MBB4966494.1 hypothetical protein [Saccharothrix violaceirubra]
MTEAGIDALLVDRLSTGAGRLGWEYVEPRPVAAGPEDNRPPVWVEPAPVLPPDTTGRNVFIGCGTFLLVGSLMCLPFLVVSDSARPVLFSLIGLGALTIALPTVISQAKAKEAEKELRARREFHWTEFQRGHRQWQERVAAHNAAELTRWVSTPRWYPVGPRRRPGRVDVFGGSADGWAALLATYGSTLLDEGVFVLDLTEQWVADGLTGIAERSDLDVDAIAFPTDGLDVFAGLPDGEIAELLAAALGAAQEDVRALHVDLIGAVLDRLAGPTTLSRVVAGLKTLRGNHVEGALSEAETDLLTAAADTVAGSEQARRELRFITGMLDLVTAAEPADAFDDLWPESGITVITTVGPHQRRKNFADRLLFHRVLHRLRDTPLGTGRGVLVVAGADDLGGAALRELARQAERAGVPLVLLMRTLDEDLQPLLGSADSVAVVMRLGNAREAAVAAGYLGREHRFQLSALTFEVGRTLTGSRSYARGGAQGTSTTTGEHGVTTTRTSTWQRTTGYAEADSTGRGATLTRSYEFAVEPTTIQSLPVTSFVLVEDGQSGRRVVLGDCNPGIALLDKVSPTPR